MKALRAATIILLPTLALAAVVITGSARPLQAAARARPSASATGIMINYPIAEDVDGMPSLAFQGTLSKTRLALVVDSPEGGIIGYDRDTSKVTRFADSAGKSLIDPEAPFGPFAFGDRIVQNGHRLALELESPEAPSPGATSVLATGTIDVSIAHEKRTYTSEPAPLEDYQGVQAGPIQMTIKSYGKANWGGGHELRVVTTASLDAIIQWTAILPDGSRVPLDRRSTMSFDGTSDVTLACETDLGEVAAIEVETWHDPKVRHVPFKIVASVGLE